MADIVCETGDIIEMRVLQIHGDTQVGALNIFTYRATTDFNGTGDGPGIVVAFANKWEETVNVVQESDAWLARLQLIRRRASGGQTLAERTYDESDFDADGAEFYRDQPEMALCINRRSSVPGRKGMGRTFFAFIPQAHLSERGLWQDTNLDPGLSDLDNLYPIMDYSLTDLNGGMRAFPCVVGANTITAAADVDMVSWSVKRTPSYLRSRRYILFS